MPSLLHRHFKLGIAIGVLTLALLTVLPAGVALASGAPSARITGQVTEKATGDPIEGVSATVYVVGQAGKWSWAGEGFTDSSGYYDVGGLAGGTYRVAFDDESGYYARQYYHHKPIPTLADRVVVGAGGTADAIDAALVQAETDAPLTGDDAPRGWQTIGATVTLTPTDAGSGVFATYYKLNGGTTKTYTGPIAMVARGANTLEYWSIDWAGNTEVAHRTSFIVFAAPSGNGTPSTPSTPSTVKHGVSFTTFGCIVHHASGTSPVTLQFYRLEHGRWVLRKSTTAKASGIDGLTFSKYSDSTSLPSAGQWRVRARHKSGSHLQYSGYRTFTVS